MRVVEQSFEKYPSEYDVVKRIERVARVCYKSEDKITEDSAYKMVRALVNSKHYAMLEHAAVCFTMSLNNYIDMKKTVDMVSNQARKSFYLRFTNLKNPLVSGNIRAWLEFIEACIEHNVKVFDSIMNMLRTFEPIFDNMYPAFLQRDSKLVNTSTLTGDEKIIHHRETVEFITDRGISHEIVRHRPCSFAQESTRYCNYGKGQFGREISVIKPLSFEEGTTKYEAWKRSCEVGEGAYFSLLDLGASPQEARDVLPTCLKTSIVVTATLEEWRHILDLRVLEVTGKAHPKIKALMTPLYEILKDDLGKRLIE